MIEDKQFDGQTEAALRQQDFLNVQMPLEDEMANLAIVDDSDIAYAKLKLEQVRNGVEPLPDDPTLRAAVNALLLENEGYDYDGAKNEAVLQDERTLSPEKAKKLLKILRVRFEVNMKRHRGIKWSKVGAKLAEASPEKLWSLNEMEITGGEPDVVGYDKKTGEYEFFDCSAESPIGRANVCYDREGQEEAERQGYSPAGNAVDMVAAMGLGGLLTEEQTGMLQELGRFDMKTSSWIEAPAGKGEQGVALYAYRRNVGVFVFGSYSNFRSVTRAFRGWLKV